jgi:flagellar protein FlaG
MVSAIQPRNSQTIGDLVEARSSDASKIRANVIETIHVPKAEAQIDQERIKQNLEIAIDRLNTQMRDGGRNVQFSIDSESKTPVVKVTKSDTGEVIRQIPNEAVLKAGHSVATLRGMLHNEIA